MKRNLIIISGLALVVIAAYFTLSGDKEPIRYDPIVYEDGSVEYRLINSGKDRVRGNEDDQHWVLRFPKEIRSNTAEAEIEALRGEPPSPRFHRNHNMNLYLTLPDLVALNKESSPIDEHRLVVSMCAFESLYGSVLKDKSGSGFSYQHDVLSNRACRKDIEIQPGLFSLRNPTEEEKQIMRVEYGKSDTPPERDCGDPSQSIIKYSVYDSLGLPQGYGWCRLGHKGSCRFRFWLPQERKVLYGFDTRFLPMIHEIHEFVAELMATATDENKSINMFKKDE